MSSPQNQPVSHSTRLVGVISDLLSVSGENTTTLSHKTYSDRLIRLIDMADSVRLSDAHARIKRGEFSATGSDENTVEGLKAAYSQGREALVRLVVQSFSGEAHPMSTVLPAPSESFEPYYRFYAAHQRTLDYRVSQLHLKICQQASALSPEAGRLVLLDQVLSEVLLTKIKGFISNIPKLLAKKFTADASVYALDASCVAAREGTPWVQTGGGLEAFVLELKKVLLAELELRLMPTAGIVESLCKEGL